MKHGVSFGSKLDHKTRFIKLYGRLCPHLQPYAEFDDQDTDDEDEREEEGEDLNHQKKIVQLGKEEHMGQDALAKVLVMILYKKLGYMRKRIANTRKIKSPKLTEEKKAMKVKRQNEEKKEMEEAKEATRKIRLGICAMDKSLEVGQCKK